MAGVKTRHLAGEERQRRPASLGAIAESGLGIFCWCNRCGHNAVLPIGALIAELGPAFPVPEVGARTRCTGCGSKDVATRPAWPSMGPVARHD